MIRIDSIEIRDFRGFPADAVAPIRLQGKKNLLVYGENGSGKSTIFHALKHLFDRRKSLEYDSDVTKEQCLKNQFSGASFKDGCVRVSFAGTETDEVAPEDMVWSIDGARPEEHTLYALMSNAAAFLDYRAILRTHLTFDDDRQGPVDIFPVLMGLIRAFPFPTREAEEETYGSVYEGLLEDREEFLRLDIREFYTFDELEKEPMALARFGQEDEDEGEQAYDEEKAFEAFKDKLKQELRDRMRRFDKEMEVLRVAIEARANDFLAGVEKRYEGFDPFLRIHLRYTPPEEVYTEDGKEDEGELPMLDIPAPRLEIGATFRGHPFSEPGIILNEARMTALALVFYLAALKRVVPESSQAPKLLVLDDVLLGLDMAHRRPVLELLMREFKKWQIILLTFDRAWYEVGKQQLDSDHWKWYEAYAVRVGKYEQPVVDEDEDHLLRALAHLYPVSERGLPDPKAAAVHVRSQFEKVLRKACEDRGVPLPFKSNPRKVTANEMWGGVQALTYEVEQKPKHIKGKDGVVTLIATKSKTSSVVPEKLQRRVTHALSWVLNPLSHSQSIDRYRAEIEDAIFAIEDLETVLGHVTPAISKARKDMIQELLKALQKKQESGAAEGAQEGQPDSESVEETKT